MDLFDLPVRTKVAKVIPKNKFDAYTNTKQKKLFTDYILRITWTHKLSADTVNLDTRDIREIQIFKIELKQKSKIPKIIEIIDKAIPYHILFWIEYDREAYLSTASKHPHPTNEDRAVIDWTFTTDWFPKDKNRYILHLKGSIDAVFKDFCVQLTGKPNLAKQSLDSILKNQQTITRLKKEITKLQAAISRTKQFNEKVALNLKLKEAEKQLEKVENDDSIGRVID